MGIGEGVSFFLLFKFKIFTFQMSPYPQVLGSVFPMCAKQNATMRFLVISYYLVTHPGSGHLEVGGDDVKTRGDYVSRLIYQRRGIIGSLRKDYQVAPSPPPSCSCHFSNPFLKPTLALGRRMEPPQTDEMLNWGEPACPNDPPQKVGGVKKSASSAVPAR